MLVLSRRTNESIVFSNGIRVMVAHIAGGQVKLAIEAPADIVILRDDLVQGPENREQPKEIGEERESRRLPGRIDRQTARGRNRAPAGRMRGAKPGRQG